jgi:hypothetical protein
MSSLSNSSHSCFDGVLLAGDEKKNKIAASFSPSPAMTTAFVLLAAILFFFSLAGSAHAEFGVERFALSARNENGTPDVQAGSHPYALNATIVLKEPGAKTGNLKDVKVQLPPGLVGNPDATPKCTYQEFIRQVHGGPEKGQCPNETVVGVATFYQQSETDRSEAEASSSAVYNLVPPAGVAAEFGYVGATYTPVLLEESVRTGSDYGITTTVPDINDAVNLYASKVTIWGTPAAAVHNDWRGSCVETRAGGSSPVANGFGLSEGEDEVEGPLLQSGGEPEGLPTSTGKCETDTPLTPLLTMPTECGEPLTASASVDSWQEPGNFLGAEGTRTKTTSLPELSGCGSLALSPRLTVTPDKPDASTSSGLAVNVKVPQEGTLSPGGLSEADLRDTTVVLPPGVALNPSSANGLEACSEDLATFTGMSGEINPGSETATFTPFLPGGSTALLAGEKAVFQAGVNFCPNASKIGTVRFKLAILEHPLEGAVYLAAQEANPFGSLMAIYVVAEDPVSGVVVKLAGEVTLCKNVGEDPRNAAGEPIPGVSCQAVGQVVTTLLNTPQAPAEEVEFHFFGGEKAPLTTPAYCGTYKTQTSFVPWGGETQHPSPGFEINAGPNGGPCPGSSLPFSPGLTGGALNLNAGAFSPFTLTMNRADGEQNMQSVEAHLPPGLSGILSNVELCPEPQANLGECGPNSLIGETTVSVGVGGDPYTVTGGKFYLTGPYNGTGSCTVAPPGGSSSSGCAPFGITFAVPAKAGPFDLANTQHNKPVCDCIVVRGKIEVNPLTAALTVTSNPPGTPYAIPTSIEGIPLEIQHINAVTTRGNFQFNPTNCNKMEVTGTIHSSEGGTDTIGVPFQVTNCPSLKFTPKFSVSTSGKTSKAKGASLTTKVEEPAGALTTQANLTKVKVELPKQLPSRLTTLQKACTDAQFELNPANCPSESKIGYAVVHTPLIPVPLEGPAIFVSHGGEAFPSLTMVLQGYGVTIDLVGTTFISKSGVTSTTFKTVPDQPFSSFELTLPEGKYSALAANGNLCAETKTVTSTKKETKRVKGKLKKVSVKVKKTEAVALTMPTEFIAQNGAEIKETTPIAVTGCAKAVPAKKAKHKKGKKIRKKKS